MVTQTDNTSTDYLGGCVAQRKLFLAHLSVQADPYDAIALPASPKQHTRGKNTMRRQERRGSGTTGAAQACLEKMHSVDSVSK